MIIGERNMVKIKVKLLENGILPVKKHESDACFDCYIKDTVVLQKGERKTVSLGFRLEIPFGYEGVIRGRSGLTSQGFDVSIGTIDSGYRGEVRCTITNNTGKIQMLCGGERICQLSIKEVLPVEMFEVEELDENTDRGECGFGSTGKF
jgi:dUTP pyrophosphatase